MCKRQKDMLVFTNLLLYSTVFSSKNLWVFYNQNFDLSLDDSEEYF